VIKGISVELWEKLEDTKTMIRPIPERIKGEMAFRRGSNLRWADEHKERVSADRIINGMWEVFQYRQEEKGIETEKWMREPNDSLSIRYIDCEGYNYKPSAIMDRKAFLRFVGTMPAGREWPGYAWTTWVDKDGRCCSFYNPDLGHTLQLFAEYAEMRVEK